MPDIKTYLVGGAVRDKLLHKPVKERDWVVVGATPEFMLKLGYKPVGKDFPVFLHPDTHEEYALARSERKVAPGYQGFVFHTSPEVPLEQDLMRRDLTINAIAEDEQGNLTDPYHGLADLEQKVLRHVSQAFVEDPVRLLRIARFASYLPDFNIAPETLTLLETMVTNGEVDALVPERVWAECAKTCLNTDIEPFFNTLDQSGALAKIFPGLQLSMLDFVAFKEAAKQCLDPINRWAALWHRADPALSVKIMKHLKIPKAWQEHLTLVQQYQDLYLKYPHLEAHDILDSLMRADALRRPERILNALTTLHTCFPNTNKPDLELLIDKLKKMPIQPFLEQGLEGVNLAQAIKQSRLQAIHQYLHSLF